MEFDLGGIRKGETYQDEGFELVCGETGDKSFMEMDVFRQIYCIS